MKVSRSRYQKEGSPVNVNIRLERGGAKPTREEVLDALRFIRRNGRVPEGWRFAAIDWQRPSWATNDWQTGDISHLMGNLSPVIDTLLDQNKARVGIVRRGEG